MPVINKIERLQKASELKAIVSIILPIAEAFGEDFNESFMETKKTFQNQIKKISNEDSPSVTAHPLAMIHDLTITVMAFRTADAISEHFSKEQKDEFMDSYVDMLSDSVMNVIGTFMQSYWSELVGDMPVRRAVTIAPNIKYPVVKLDLLDQYPTAEEQHKVLDQSEFVDEYQDLFKRFAIYLQEVRSTCVNEIKDLGIHDKEDISNLVDELRNSGELNDVIIANEDKLDTEVRTIH